MQRPSTITSPWTMPILPDAVRFSAPLETILWTTPLAPEVS
jgi:hypothetical protein